MDAAALRDAVRAAGIDVEPTLLDVVDSTNTALLEMAARGAPAWTVVAAREQTGGRGRLGRSWYSPRDSSLALSVLLRPDGDAAGLSILALAAGVAMADACSAVARLDVRCKWPNDLMVEERKVGGILSEAVVRAGRATSVVLGTGVNLTQGADAFPPELRPVATSLLAEGGTVDGPAIVTAYLGDLRAVADGPDPAGATLPRYRRLCLTLGRRVVVSVPRAGRVEGDAVDLDRTGALLVRTAAGTERIAFGEVVHVR